MGRPGFEPETSRLKAECSTAELATLGWRRKRSVSMPIITLTWIASL